MYCIELDNNYYWSEQFLSISGVRSDKCLYSSWYALGMLMILNGNEILINNWYWPLFHLWHHHLWPKLPVVSPRYIPKFCVRKIFLPLIPRPVWLDQLIMNQLSRKMLRSWSEKLEGEISLIYTWLLCSKNFPTWWCFLKNSWTGSKHRRMSTTAAKREEKEKKGKQTLKKKNENPKDFAKVIFPSKN